MWVSGRSGEPGGSPAHRFFMSASSTAHPRPARPGGCCRHRNLRSETGHIAPKGFAFSGLLSVKRSHELDRKRVCFSGRCQGPTSAACSNETYRRCPPCGHRSQVPVERVGLASRGTRRRHAKMAGREIGPQCHIAVRQTDIASLTILAGGLAIRAGDSTYLEVPGYGSGPVDQPHPAGMSREDERLVAPPAACITLSRHQGPPAARGALAPGAAQEA